MVPDEFLEFYYGKYRVVDLHTLTKEDAKIELLNAINSTDINIKCLVIVHGYHGGTVIKNLVRKEFQSDFIEEKINLDAGRTIYKLKN
jgi:DNA-nicking Smr family endonuclease